MNSFSSKIADTSQSSSEPSRAKGRRSPSTAEEQVRRVKTSPLKDVPHNYPSQVRDEERSATKFFQTVPRGNVVYKRLYIRDVFLHDPQDRLIVWQRTGAWVPVAVQDGLDLSKIRSVATKLPFCSSKRWSSNCRRIETAIAAVNAIPPFAPKPMCDQLSSLVSRAGATH